MTAGPAIVAAWMPASEKMPAPIMTPSARKISSPVPNTAGSRCRALVTRSIASSAGSRRARPPSKVWAILVSLITGAPVAPMLQGTDDGREAVSLALCGGLARRQPGVRHRQEELHRRADRHRVEHRADADRAAEHEPDHEHRHLDRGPQDPDAVAGAAHEAQPQAVARAGAEVGTDVHRTGQPVADHAGDQHDDAQPELVRAFDEGEAGVGGQADDDDVEHRAEARHLAQRDPQQQHQGSDHDDDLAERERQVLARRPGGTRPTGRGRGRRAPSAPS